MIEGEIIPSDEGLTDAVLSEAKRIVYISYKEMEADMKSGERPFVSRRFYAHHTRTVTMLEAMIRRDDAREQELIKLRASLITVNILNNVLVGNPAEKSNAPVSVQTPMGELAQSQTASTRASATSTSVSDEQTGRRPARGYKRDNAAVKKAFKWLSRNPSAIDTPVRQLAVRIKVGKDSVLRARKFIKDGFTDIDAALAEDVK